MTVLIDQNSRPPPLTEGDTLQNRNKIEPVYDLDIEEVSRKLYL